MRSKSLEGRFPCTPAVRTNASVRRSILGILWMRPSRPLRGASGEVGGGRARSSTHKLGNYFLLSKQAHDLELLATDAGGFLPAQFSDMDLPAP